MPASDVLLAGFSFALQQPATAAKTQDAMSGADMGGSMKRPYDSGGASSGGFIRIKALLQCGNVAIWVTH